MTCCVISYCLAPHTLERLTIHSRPTGHLGYPIPSVAVWLEYLFILLRIGFDAGGVGCRPDMASQENVFSSGGGKMSEVIAESQITCPACGHQKQEVMPTDACQWFYECEGCHVILIPKQGDCCVYCSYGSVKCPPIQDGNACC